MRDFAPHHSLKKMPAGPWSQDTLHAFQDAVQSLKLYRRADLQDPDRGNSLIEQLYVDPQPAEHVFRTALKPHTTYVVGRKGTGKSTIFQRLQAELRKDKHQTSAYVDMVVCVTLCTSGRRQLA